MSVKNYLEFQSWWAGDVRTLSNSFLTTTVAGRLDIHKSEKLFIIWRHELFCFCLLQEWRKNCESSRCVVCIESEKQFEVSSPFFWRRWGAGWGGGLGSILFLKTYVLSVWSCLYYLKSVAVPLLLYHVSVHFLPLCFCNDPHLFANCFQMCLVLSLTPRPFCQYSSHSFC